MIALGALIADPVRRTGPKAEFATAIMRVATDDGGSILVSIAGAGFSADAFATRAAFAVSASAAIFFCESDPGCTTPHDMIRVAASSALISTSISLLFGT